LLDPAQPVSTDAAVYGAAHAVLVILHPQSRGAFDLEYQAFLNSTPATSARANGLALGNLIGLLTVDSRSGDGATTQVPYIPSEAPGHWRRTPPDYRPPLDPHWRYVDAFCLPDLEPYVVPPPPDLASPAYADEVHQVHSLGALLGSTRTPEQSQIAVFWSDFNYTATPPGHWQEIATGLSTNFGLSLAENARLSALLSLAQADAAIVTWEGKYRHNFWRPITAIHRADEDSNAATLPDTNWNSYLTSPPFPEYPSGHSSFSRASATVLAAYYGTDTLSFDATSDSLPGIVRSFTSLSACADEVGMSRIYGGIHFMSANVAGKASGAEVGRYVVENFLLPNDQLPLLRWEKVAGGPLQLRVHGYIGSTCVVEASPDLHNWNGVFTNIAVVGGFTYAPSLSAMGGRFFRIREEQYP